MAGERKRNSLVVGALLSTTLSSVLCAAQTVRHRQERVETDLGSAALTQAEQAIEKKDYATAEKLLLPVVNANPKDDVAWYDLGFVYGATERRPQAIDAYRKSVNAKPDSYHPNLNLGLLLAQSGQDVEAGRYVKAALKLMPENTPRDQKAMNWMALGRLEEKSAPKEALAAFSKAAELSPQDAQPHLAIAKSLAATHDNAGAEKEYKQALAIAPDSREAKLALIDLYREEDRGDEAAAMLRDYAKENPQDPRAHLAQGQSLLKAGDADGAAKEFDEGLKESPGNVALLHEVAAMYAAQMKWDLAAQWYSELVKTAPDNAEYHYQYGVTLIQGHKFPEAQQQLIAALQRDAKLTEAYGELAVAASENKQYPLVIKVLDARSKIQPDTPGTYFLRATAYDYLKDFSHAAENYHKFLEASSGRFPDNEWQARHRLIAIEPDSKKKK